MPGHLISLDEARNRVLDSVRRLPPEPVPADEALGRVLAEDVAAELDLPPFDPSAMDGFAVIAGPAGELEVIGESRAGRPFSGELGEGRAIRISTGAMVPAGERVAVVPVERAEEADGRVRVPATEPGAHIRRAGEDVRAGEVVIAAGTEIGPAEVGMLAALGRRDVRCARMPRVAVVATGDELRPPGAHLRPGQIYDSTAAALEALVRRAGGEPAGRVHVEDDEAAVRSALGDALAGSDVLLVSGGVSVGPHDHVKPALDALGVEEIFWGVRLKPGKPLWFGRGRDGTLVFGLPGNPVSAIVTFLLFSRPALRAMQGADPGVRRTTAVLDSPVRRTGARDEAVRVRLSSQPDGWHADPTGAQDSHVLSSLLGARGLALIPAGEGELAAGEPVTVELI